MMEEEGGKSVCCFIGNLLIVLYPEIIMFGSALFLLPMIIVQCSAL